MKQSRITLIGGLLVALASCSGTRNDVAPTATEVSSTTSPAVSSSTSSSTSTTTLPPLLVDTFVPTGTDSLLPIDTCKIGDVTPSTPNGRPIISSGFPLPEGAVSQVGTVKMWVIPVETNDFAASEVGLADLESSLERVTQFYDEQSYGQLTIDAVFEPRDHWVRLPGTAADFGFDSSRPHQDFSSVMEEILKAWKPSGSVDDGDLVFAVLPPVPEVVVTMSTRRFDLQRFNNVLLENGVLLSSGGNEIRTWELHAHEIGHSLMRLEDLYHGRADVPYEEYMGKWDIMDQAVGLQPTFSSWSRWRSGWIRDDEVLCVDPTKESTHFVGQLDETDAEVKTLVVPRSDHSVVVIDVRRIANASKPVALTYVVDTSKEHQLGPYRVKTQFFGEDTVEVEGVTLTLVARDASGAIVSVAPAP